MASTVIIGAGIVGVSTAYYLLKQQPGSSIHLVDSSPELFASASGYAGGFLIRSWFEGSPGVAALAALSFDEHKTLAERENGRDKWRYGSAVALEYGRTRRSGDGGKDWMRQGGSRAGLVRERRTAEGADVPAWLKRSDGDIVAVVDSGDGAAILDPLKLCHFLLEKCKGEGVQVHYPATVLSVGTDMRDELSYVRIGYTDSSTETEIPATRVLLSAGAWTPRVFASLFSSSSLDVLISSLAGHSLVIKKPGHNDGDDGSETEIKNHMVFSSLPDSSISPEFCSRPGGVVYFAGVNSAAIPLPRIATDAATDADSLRLLDSAARAVVELDGDTTDLDVVRQGVCFRPVTQQGTPYIDRLADEQLGSGIRTRPGAEGGVFLAAGHGPWGISQGLGTGLVVAELMGGKETSVDISGLGLPQETLMPHGGDVFSMPAP